jgi:hypothetical protein
VKFDQTSTGDDIIDPNKVWLIGEWDSWSFFHQIRDIGNVDTLPDIPGDQIIDDVADDNILGGYAFFTDPDPAERWEYSIIGQHDVTGQGTVQYDAGYFSPQFNRKLLASNVESNTVLNFTDEVVNRILPVDTTVKFTFRIPTSFASQGDLTASGVNVRLQGGRNFGGGNIINPMQHGGADVGQVMTLDAGQSDSSFTVFTTTVNFTRAADAFDVGSYRFVIQGLGTGDWYPPDARYIDQDGISAVDPDFAETSIHIHVFRINDENGFPNDQDISMEFIDGNFRVKPTYDVPNPATFLSADKNWSMYE